MAEFLQKLNAGKAVSAAGMTLSEIVETIYIPYTQEKRASTRIKDSPDTLASSRISFGFVSARSTRRFSSVQKTFHRRARQVADSRQLGFSKKLVNKHLITER